MAALPTSLAFDVDAIVFDCDGVLVDSLVGADASWRRWALDFGVDPVAVLAHMNGRPSRESVAVFIAEPLRVEALRHIDRYEIEAAAEVTPMPGAGALLASLPWDRWGIVTSAGLELFGARIGAARLPVPPVVITADDVVQGKPHPEGYLAALTRLGVDPSRAAIFEDSNAGIAAAIATGAAVVVRVGTTEAGPGLAAVVRDLRSVSWDGRLVIHDSLPPP